MPLSSHLERSVLKDGSYASKTIGFSQSCAVSLQEKSCADPLAIIYCAKQEPFEAARSSKKGVEEEVLSLGAVRPGNKDNGDAHVLGGEDNVPAHLEAEFLQWLVWS